MKKVLLIALAVVTLGACGYDAQKHPEADGCWIITNNGWNEDVEGVACEVELDR